LLQTDAFMSAIEPLLGIIHLKKANGLILASDAVPALLVAGERRALTMPPLSRALLNDLLDEVLTSEQRQTLDREGAVQSTYQSPTHGSFAVSTRVTEGRTELTFKLRRGAPAPVKPVTPPQDVAVPTPTSVAPTSSATGAAGSISAALDAALSVAASDIILTAGSPPAWRADGVLMVSDGDTVSDSDLLAWCAAEVQGQRRRTLDESGQLDFATTHGQTRLRVNLFRHTRGLAAAIRVIRSTIPSLSDLKLPARLSELMRARTGLVLLTGATGSGKSTTLAALIQQTNRVRPCHVVTLEDPIEFVYPAGRAIIHQREVGTHVESFSAGVRAALRENPDIILIGELRDPTTIRLALTAAETGHLVLATLHSGSAVMAIDRVLDVFVEADRAEIRQQLAGVLRHVISQQLLPGASGGLVPVLEILAVNHAVAAQVREGRTHMLATQMELGSEEGMISMQRALADAVHAGLITREVAVRASDNPSVLQGLLADRGRIR
jgi:twitching motility protein PilT